MKSIPLVLLLAATAFSQTTVNGRRSFSGSVNAQTSTYQVLASDFNSPCGFIPVASGTFTITLVASGSQPPAGQCVTILNYGTGVVTLARSGQNINGAASNLTGIAGSATAPTGWTVTSDGTNYEAIVLGGGGGGGGQYSTCASLPAVPAAGTVLNCSDWFPYVYVSTGSAWQATIFGYQVTPPVLGNFTQIATGNSTLTTTHGGIIWTTPSAGSSHAPQLIALAIPGSGAYCADAAWISDVQVGNGGAGVTVNAGLLTSNAFAAWAYGYENSSAFNGQEKHYSNSTSFSSNNNAYNTFPVGPLIWSRFRDDRSTTRTFSLSFNGITFKQVSTETRTQDFTPADVGFGLFNFAAGMTVWIVHWNVYAC
jgi:hypothetical protein